ncbi:MULTISPECIES: hypothetical protein [Lactobacillus]|uniref:Uncharacterized protein n=1 Tax=Lactobacillus xujianguonis TaxID=2495899 RepID=A0A437SS69_9LACO|nr:MULTISPECIES: hypothetical protein [Lactobacillus]RVU69789.1 hypothetical protein EJK17_11220 [Lactobacillus xujianguonis]RVU71897.1 hypothetical protein EJK20_11365 [Lactobacillus xujianguonis]
MNNFIKWQDRLEDEAETYKQELVNEALTCGTYDKGIKFLKGLKQGLPTAYSGTPEQVISNLLDSVIEDAIRDVRDKALKAKVVNND